MICDSTTTPRCKLLFVKMMRLFPFYILDERFLERDEWGIRRTGPFRLQFLLESLNDLREHLQELGSDLIFLKGTPEEHLPRLSEKYNCDTVYAAKEYTREEVDSERAISDQLKLILPHSSTLIHPDDTPFSIDALPEVFTTFRKKVEKYSEVRSPIPTPEKINSPELETTDIPTL